MIRKTGFFDTTPSPDDRRNNSAAPATSSQNVTLKSAIGHELHAWILEGGKNMKHYLFEREDDARNYLTWLKTGHDSPLTSEQTNQGIQKANVTNTKDNYPHQYENLPIKDNKVLYRIRISQEQDAEIQQHVATTQPQRSSSSFRS